MTVSLDRPNDEEQIYRARGNDLSLARPLLTGDVLEEIELPGQEERTAMITPGLQRIVDLAVANLTARTGVPAGDITVVAAETTTWPDAALGCPQPGRRYAQVPYDGAWVHLRAGGREYRYHTGGQVTEPFLCEQSTTQRDPGAPGEPMPDRRDPRLRSPGER